MFIRYCRGFTLLELMLAIALSAVISYQIIEIAAGLRLEIKRQQQQIHQFEVLRFVSHTLSMHSPVAECGAGKKSSVIGFAAHRLTLRQCIHYHERWQWLPVSYFVAQDYRGHLNLYQQPDHGERQSLSASIIDLVVKPAADHGLMLWLLSRSTSHFFPDESCYYFVDHRYCRHDGYRYLAWPVYVS